jgi:virginiamycin B lyase
LFDAFAATLNWTGTAVPAVAVQDTQPKARDPHTIAMLPDGRLFFTVQAGNFIGTLDPKSPNGAIKLVESPTVNSRPYGVRLTSKGGPFFDEFNSNKIAREDEPVY